MSLESPNIVNTVGNLKCLRKYVMFGLQFLSIYSQKWDTYRLNLMRTFPFPQTSACQLSIDTHHSFWNIVHSSSKTKCDHMVGKRTNDSVLYTVCTWRNTDGPYFLFLDRFGHYLQLMIKISYWKLLTKKYKYNHHDIVHRSR